MRYKYLLITLMKTNPCFTVFLYGHVRHTIINNTHNGRKYKKTLAFVIGHLPYIFITPCAVSTFLSLPLCNVRSEKIANVCDWWVRTLETHKMACKSWKIGCVVLRKAYYHRDVHYQVDTVWPLDWEKSTEQTDKQGDGAKSLIAKEERDV